MKNKENIKTFVLWLLFLSTIALVIIRYDLLGISKINVPQKKISDRIFNYVVVPDKINIRLSNYDVTSILLEKDDYYEQILSLLHNAFVDKTSIKQIGYDEYEEAKTKSGVTLIYSSIPPKYIEKSLNLKKTPLSTVDYIEQIFIKQEEKQIYVKTLEHQYVMDVQTNNNTSKIKELENTDYIKYYTKLEKINDNKDLYLPLNFYLSMKNIDTVDILSTKSITDLARSIFADRFDFATSMIQKSGTYFYSYSNGKEILKIHPNSLLEYKKESVQNVQDDIDLSTNEMFNFLSILGIDENSIKIKSVNKIRENSKTVYEFVIKRQKDGVEIDFVDEKEDGVIRVIGDTVIYANIMLKNIGEYQDEDNSILEVSKVLNNNIEYVKKTVCTSDVSYILKNIKDISLVYKNYGDVLYPTYKYEIGETSFFINAVNGDIDAIK